MSFGWKSVGHFFASAAHDAKVVGTFLQSHQTQIAADLQLGATLVSVADPALAPAATIIERASESVLGEVLAVVNKVTDAEAAHGVNVVFDSAAITEFKSLIALIEKLKPGTIGTAAMVAAAPVAA